MRKSTNKHWRTIKSPMTPEQAENAWEELVKLWWACEPPNHSVSACGDDCDCDDDFDDKRPLKVVNRPRK